MRNINKFILIVGIACCGSFARGQGSHAGHHGAHHGHGGELKSVAPLSDASIYQLESAWTDQDGKSLRLKDLAGRPRLVVMLYTSCTSACPMLVGEIKDVLSKLTKSERKRISPLVFSFDPERDTPAALKAFAKKMKVAGEDWAFLSGSSGDVSELAGALGVQYKKLDSGDYLHSNTIFLLNKKGEIAAKKEGLKTPAEVFLSEIKKNLHTK
jgi:protein SCO1/2